MAFGYVDFFVSKLMKVKPFLHFFLASSLAHAGLLRPLPLFPGDETSPDYELLVDGQPVPVAFGEFHGGVSFHYASFEIGEPPSRKTPWTVYHAAGYQTTVFPSETKTDWHRLGVYDLNAESWVRLVDPHYQLTDGPVVADAVRFVRTRP
jgi:hypothetical protein